jgi:gliding-associated putative ABC transporter substrate-binding component GldG
MIKFSGKRKTAIFRLILVFGILILINFISVRIFSRIDLTKSGIYTLSEVSKDIVRKLDDKVTIKAYFSEDLPAPYNNNRRALLDMLEEYKAYGGDKVVFEFISPTVEKAEQEAQENGIPPIEIQIVQDDKVEVKRVYMGVTFIYEGKKEVIPVIQDLAGLEYDISGSIKRLLKTEAKSIGVTIGNDELPIDKMQVVNGVLSQQYDVIPLDLNVNPEIPQEISAVLIIDPKKAFTDSAKMAIDKYLVNGGKLGLFGGKYMIDPTFQNKTGELLELGLDDMLLNYGIRISQDIIRDAQCATILVARQEGQYQIATQVQYPYILRVTNFNEDNIIGKSLNNLILQFVSSIDTTAAKGKSRATVLAYSSEAAATQEDGALIDPFHNYSEKDFPLSNLPVAVLYEAKFSSFYGIVPIDHKRKSRIIVVGSGLFMTDEIVDNARDNLTFFANIVDYLTDDSGLIQIRSKVVSVPPLKEVPEANKKIIKYGNMLIPPLFFILFGIYRWRRRVAKKRAIETALS